MTTYAVAISYNSAAMLAVLMDKAGQDRVEITEAELDALGHPLPVEVHVDTESRALIVERVK